MAKKKDEGVEEVYELSVPIAHKEKPTHVSVDFPSEGLNNLARKINEIIDYL